MPERLHSGRVYCCCYTAVLFQLLALAQGDALANCGFGCARSTSCTSLCEAAGDQCQSIWTEDHDNLSCLVAYPTSANSTDGASSAGDRVVTSHITYRIRKHVLSDLLHRYEQVRHAKSEGRYGGPNLQRVDQEVLRVAVSLAFPRLTLAVRALLGTSMPRASVCCHQECHWEEMLSERTMPSLQSLLARSVTNQEQTASDSHTCNFRSQHSAGAGHRGLLGQVLWSSDQPGWQLGRWLLQLAGVLSWRNVGYLAWWAVAPSLMVALDAMQICSEQPLLALLVTCMACGQTLAEWHTLHVTTSDTSLPLTDRLICHLSSSLVVQLIMMLITGVSAYILVPSLAHPAQSVFLWLMIGGLPALSVTLMHAARKLHHALSRSERAWMCAEMEELRQLLGLPHDTALAAAAAMRAAIMGREELEAAARSALGLGTLQGQPTRHSVTDDANLLLDTLQQLLLPSVEAQRVQRSGSDRPQASPQGVQASVWQQVSRPTRNSSGGVRATVTMPRASTHQAQPGSPTTERWQLDAELHSRGRRGDHVQQAVGAAIDGTGDGDGSGSTAGQADSLLLRLVLHGPGGGVQEGDGGSGSVRAASEAGAGTTTGPGSPGSSPSRSAALPAGATDAVPTGGTPGETGAHLRTRQEAAQAAFAAIHWPPPLDLPAWLEDSSLVPHAFRCPITLSLMREPTQASSGVTYERHALLQWLSRHRVDPVTHVPIKRHRLTPNLNLRHMIEDWVAMQVAGKAAGKLE